MKSSVYKHWKKILLSLLAFFWSGCENEDDAVATYGCFSTICYNATATNDLGEVFDIIECNDGYKYLRQPGIYDEHPELQEKLPEGVEIQTPPAGSCGAQNCTYKDPEYCYKESYTTLEGTVKEYDYCVPTINCPEKH
jgi:hypothetical protein